MFDPAVARRIRLVGLDVDGIMTDGMVYVGESGTDSVELKRFDIRDGIGVLLMRDCGIRVAIISGRYSAATVRRATELGIDDVIQDDGAEKLRPFEQLLARDRVTWAEAAFLGDDLPDLPILRRVALPVTVPDAMPDVRVAVPNVLASAGGQGAVREFAESLLRARGEWDDAVNRYLYERGERQPELTGT